MSVLNVGQMTLDLSADQVRVLLGGLDFLRYLDVLPQMRLVAVCRQCVRADGVGNVVATVDTIHPRIFVSCAHRSGQVSTKKPLELTKLLDALGWTLSCAACRERVHGDNDPAGTVFRVDCPCTSRVFRLPVAVSPTATVGEAPVAGVGR